MRAITRAALATGLVVLAPLAGRAEDAARIPTLSLDVTGNVAAQPDMAVVELGVTTEAKAAGPALTDNNERMRGLIEQLMAAGLADRDIATSRFTIEPVFVYSKSGTEPPKISGYRVSNAVTVRIRQIAIAGKLLDDVVRIGANDVRAVTFTVENDGALRDRARKDAMREALARADIYAEAGNFQLGRMLAVREAPPAIAEPVYRTRAAAADAGVPLAPGEETVSVTVNVEWEILPKR